MGDALEETPAPIPMSRAPPIVRSKLVEFLFVFALLAAWIVLQIWVLPKMGVRT
jgi:hypothetical protein